MKNHSGCLEKSERLQRIKKVFCDGLPHTNWEILRRTKTCSVSSDIHDLRVALRNAGAKYTISKPLYWGRSRDGRKVNRYKKERC